MAKGSSVIEVAIVANTKGFKSGLDKASKSISGFTKGMGRAAGKVAKGFAIMGGAAIGLGVVAGKHLLGVGEELLSLDKKIETVFTGKSLASVENWADEVAGRMGLTSTAAQGLAANAADLLKPMGFTAEAAAEMSTEIVGLSGALSEWSGGQRSVEETAEILQKALLGERDSLKTLGISISHAEVDQRALIVAQLDGRDAITAQDKAISTQQLILEKSTDAQAAFADGGNTLTATQNRLKAKLGELEETVARKLLPVFIALAGFVLDKVVPALGRMADKAAELWEDTLKPLANDVKDLLIAAFESLSDTFDNQIRPAIKKLIDKAGDLWAKLQPLVVLVGTTIVTAAKALYDAFSKDGLAGVFEEVKEAAEPLTDWMNANQPIIAGIAAVIAVALVSAFLSWAAAAAAAAASTIIAMAPIVLLGAAIGLVAAGLVWAYQNVDWFREAIDKMKDAAVVAFGWLQDNVPPIFSAIVDGVVAMFDVVRPMIDNFVGIFVDMVQLIKAIFTGDWARVWEEAKSIFSGIITAIIDQLTLMPRLAWAALNGAFPTLWNGIKGWVSDKATALATELIAWKDAVVGFVTGIPGAIADKAVGMFDGIKEAFKSAINWIIGKWNGLGFTLPQMSFDIPLDGRGPYEFGGQKFSVPEIPRLAEGGIIDKPGGMLALIGEAGPEAVIPLSRGRNTPAIGGGGMSVTVNMAPGANGADVVRALQAYARSNGGTVPIVTGQI